MSKKVLTTLGAGLALMLAGALAAIAAPAGDGPGNDDQAVHQRFHKIIELQCNDGDDCDHSRTFTFHDGAQHFELHPDSVWLGGHGPQTFLGVQITDLTADLRAHFGAPDDAGVMISKVVDDSPASRAGLLVGDVITAVDGAAIGSPRALTAAIRGREEGEAATIELIREGGALTFSADLATRTVKPLLDLRLHCEGGDCSAGHNRAHFKSLCAGVDDCRAEINCTDGGCTCTVNGEAVDCPRHR